MSFSSCFPHLEDSAFFSSNKSFEEILERYVNLPEPEPRFYKVAGNIMLKLQFFIGMEEYHYFQAYSQQSANMNQDDGQMSPRIAINSTSSPQFGQAIRINSSSWDHLYSLEGKVSGEGREGGGTIKRDEKLHATYPNGERRQHPSVLPLCRAHGSV
ncbi:hypothetical protein Fmac_000454 [Flemingia macrophylla]|uniref:Uncharacterized protein n=1 Tax=Flemingia macrophylla TaxID=520843 RepID=A0ABD1NEC3_9FABA